MVLHLNKCKRTLIHEDTLCFVETGQWFERRLEIITCTIKAVGIYALHYILFIQVLWICSDTPSLFIYLLISIVNMNKKLFCDEAIKLIKREIERQLRKILSLFQLEYIHISLFTKYESKQEKKDLKN